MLFNKGRNIFSQTTIRRLPAYRNVIMGFNNNNVAVSRKMSSFKSQESTIYALATGGTRSAVAIVRVSGNSASKVLQDIGRFSEEHFPKPRVATVKKLYDTRNGSLLDDAMVLWFPGPHSYTGEDCCEFHVHGGIAVIRGLLKTINSIPDCRMAEPGEFTRRAFLNNKMDLTEVDGLADLISAETELQRIQALKQMNGSLGKIYETWRDRIAKCLANVEAYIDFGEDENIEADILEIVQKEVSHILQEINAHLQDSNKGERLRNGVLVCILGQPNVGKSSLLNLLCKREAAIVSSIPGTTRDIIQATINVNGYPVILADTAGIRMNPQDIIETEGIRRAIREAKNADLLVLLVDSVSQKKFMERTFTKEELIENELCNLMHQKELKDLDLDTKSLIEGKKVLIVANKSDLIGSTSNNNHVLNEEEEMSKSASTFDCSISCKTLHGFDSFLDKLGEQVAAICANPEKEETYITHERYRCHLENCVQHLQEYLKSSICSSVSTSSSSSSSSAVGTVTNVVSSSKSRLTIDYAINVLPLKDAMNSIGMITGHYGTEQILDIIFRDFCIGK